jgi:radical SAM superfamily enzyme YgiQ (UPF0313 family)
VRISLLFPKWTGGYGKFSHFADKSSSWPPLNLAMLASMAESQGHEVQMIDGQVEGLSQDEMIFQVQNFKPDIIGITATTPFYHIALQLARTVRESLPDATMVLGGHHITVVKENAFDTVFDFAFIGEADLSWPQFLDCIEKGKDVSTIKGILYRRGDIICFSGKAERVADLDILPVPARHLLKMQEYRIGTLHGEKLFTTVMTTRGCPFKCTFCSTETYGSLLRKRSPEYVVDEIESVVNKYGVRHIIFLDDTLTLDKKHFLTICDLILQHGLDITFEGSTRANLIDEELVSKMKEAGLIRISFGLESVDENIRKLMKKEVPLESYVYANRLTNKYGIETLNSCMIGLPGETIETICKTLAFLRKSKEIKQSNISIAVPYPGTELYQMAINGEYGLELMSDDFSKYRRYNAAVMKVGDLTTDNLIQLQNDAFVSIYCAPWRWLPMFRKSGIKGLMLTLARLFKSISHGKINFITNKCR